MTVQRVAEITGLLARYNRLRTRAPASDELREVRAHLLALGVVMDD